MEIDGYRLRTGPQAHLPKGIGNDPSYSRDLCPGEEGAEHPEILFLTSTLQPLIRASNARVWRGLMRLLHCHPVGLRWLVLARHACKPAPPGDVFFTLLLRFMRWKLGTLSSNAYTVLASTWAWHL